MRLLRASLVIAATLTVLAGSAWAEAEYLNCSSITPSSVDVVRINLFKGQPGDTVWAPIYLATDSVVAGFKILIRWDTTYLSPVMDSRPEKAGYIIAKLEGRFVKTNVYEDPQSGEPVTDTITDFIAQQTLENPFDSGAIMAGYNLSLPPTNPETGKPYAQYLTDAGAGIIARLAFYVKPTMPHGARANFWFHAVNEFYIDNSSGLPIQVFLDCRRTELALGFNDGLVVSYPTLASTYFEADTGYVSPSLPTISSFTADPTTIASGGSSTLSWTVTNATTVTLGPPTATVSATGQQQVSPTATTKYTLTATNGAGQVTKDVTVTVSSGGNNVPTISFTPTQTSYTIDQGQTVAFSVHASDIDNDVITLTASSKPNNSTFTQAVGTGSVSSNFSFTPDITQSGTFSAVFSASDNRGGTSIPAAVNITVNEIKKDRLFTTSAAKQAPVGGIAGKHSIVLPINLVTIQTVYGIQYDFSFDYGRFTVDSIVVSTRIPDYVVYDNIGQTPGEIRVVTFGLANEPIVTVDTTTAILYTYFSIDDDAAPGDYPVYIRNGWESTNPDPKYPSLELVTDSGIVQVDHYGDVNLDKRIDVADLVNVVAYIIGSFGLSPRQFDVADVVINSAVDVFDLVAIVNYIYGVPFSPAPPQPFTDDIAKISLSYGDVSAGSSDMMVVKSELPVEIAGVELEIRYNAGTVAMDAPRLTAAANKMALRYKNDGNGKMKVLLHFTNPFRTEDLIQTGLADLVEIPIIAKADIVAGDKSQIRLSKALLATSSAQSVEVDGVDAPLPTTFVLEQNYPNPFNPTTNIEFSLGSASNVRLDIYNVLGQRVTTLVNETLAAGPHRVLWDATTGNGHRVASGMYLYKLQVNQNSDTKKMMFLK
jgi:hypothetical protein